MSADTGSSNQSSLPSDIGTATITITRPGIDQLKTLVDSMLSSGLGVAGTVAGGIVKAIVGPLLSSALGPIENLLSVTGTGYVSVSDHSSDSSTATKNTSTTKTASCEPCMVGDWTTTNVALAGGFSGGAGGKVNIAANGTLVADMDGSTPEDGNAQTGTATWTIKLPEEPTATSGQWVQTAVSGGFSTDIGGTQRFQAAFNSTGTWTCSGVSLTYVLDYPNGDTVTWSLARLLLAEFGGRPTDQQSELRDWGSKPLRGAKRNAGYVRQFGLQTSYSRSLKAREHLASVRHQKHEVYGFASHFGTTSLGPIEVRRHKAATPLRFGMDEHSTSPPIGVQDEGHGGWRRIDIEAERPEGISTVHKDITQPHRLGKSGETESPLGRRSKTISQLRHGHVTELFGRVAHRSIRSQSAPKEDPVSARGVISAPRTRWASTSRTRQPADQDAAFHAVSSSDSTWSANWSRRRATCCCTSTVSTTLSLANQGSHGSDLCPRTRVRGEGFLPHVRDRSTATSGISSGGPKPCSASQRTLDRHRNDRQAR